MIKSESWKLEIDKFKVKLTNIRVYWKVFNKLINYYIDRNLLSSSMNKFKLNCEEEAYLLNRFKI